MKKKEIIISFTIAILIVSLFFYNFYGKKTSKYEAFVTNIIDGDTIVIEGGERVRLLGIDAAEKGEPFYKEAKSRLEELIEQKNITLEKEGENKDRYGRLLRYVFLDNKNINLLLVEEGLARCYFYGKSKYQNLCAEKEEQAIKEKIGLWQSS